MDGLRIEWILPVVVVIRRPAECIKRMVACVLVFFFLFLSMLCIDFLCFAMLYISL